MLGYLEDIFLDPAKVAALGATEEEASNIRAFVEYFRQLKYVIAILEKLVEFVEGVDSREEAKIEFQGVTTVTVPIKTFA